MKIDSIYKAIEKDSMNSSLVVIVSELEKQGYEVAVEGVKVNSKNILTEKVYEDLERSSGEIRLTLHENNIEVDKFILETIDYHDFIIRKYL